LRRADVIRHTGVDDLGSFRPVLERRGYMIRTLEPFHDDLSGFDAGEPDLVVVLGGAISVNDHGDYPFIPAELCYVERRLKSGRPIVGACLGGQMIAKAAGARVYKSQELEVGYLPVTLTPEGERSCLAALRQADCRIMHWHGDAFDLPAGATRLAYSELTENQAFGMGPNVLGLQFHMEACPRTVGGWLVCYTGDISRSGLSREWLRSEIARYGQTASDAGAATLDRWLDGISV
jgi:GMP synthase (glutamine-hydrolysing)